MEELYPVFLNLTSQPVLIVGGGAVSLRKAEGLLAARAAVTVLSPAFHAGFDPLPGICCIHSAYEQRFLRLPEKPRWRLIFAATNNAAVNAQVYADAAQQGILCCRCDEPACGDFIGPAVQRRGSVTLAVTTSGAAPGLSGELGRQLIAAADPALLAQAELSAAWRSVVLKDLPNAQRRRALLQRLSGPEMRDMIRQGGPESAQTLFSQWLAEAMAHTAAPGGTVIPSRK
jgi:precorrin-2 dehydrogenase/sirohydrochlorin ferrochelatase